MNLQQRIISFTDVTKNGYECKSPIIDIRSITGVDIACIKNGEATIYTTEGDLSCLEAWVRCDDCINCPTLRIVRCYCDENTPCPSCQNCNLATNTCEAICENKPCVGNQCVDCDATHPCANGEVCNQGTCECPPNWVRDAFNICRRCTEASHCGDCEVCYGYDCKPKTCAVGYVHPVSCACVTCYDNTHCTEANTCCDVFGQCNCCEGYYRDPISGGCIPKPKCTSDNVPACHQCVDDVAVPTSCSPGRAHVGDLCCQIVTDCKNPTCPTGFGVRRIGNICICVNCDQACSGPGGCPDGCECNNLGRCQPKPPEDCDGYCDENTPCKYGCGCNLQLKKCQSCTGVPCVGNALICSQLVGCNCLPPAVGNGAATCGASPCNKDCDTPGDCGPTCGCKDRRCIECDRPCEGNDDCEWGCYCDKGTKRCKKNPCPAVCVNGGDCGQNCGCKGAKGCYPCDSFNEADCGNVDGCSWNGTNCGEKKKVGCHDTLAIIPDDANCQLIGREFTADCCDCPDLGMYVQGEMSSTGDIIIRRKLLKGQGLNSTDLDLTGITSDYPASSGKTKITVKALLTNGQEMFVSEQLDDWSTGANLRTDTIHVSCTPLSGISIINIRLYVESTLDLTFYNGCKYNIYGEYIINGCGTTAEPQVLFINKLQTCRKPLFIWYKGDSLNTLTVFRKTYANKTGAYYEDVIGASQGLELGKYYKLETDCGCIEPTLYTCNPALGKPTKLVLCQPKELKATVTQASCLKDITLEEHLVCGIFEGTYYRLYINEVLYGNYQVVNGVLFAGGLTISYGDPVYSIQLVGLDNECHNCILEKKFILNSPCGCSTTPLTLTLDTVPNCDEGFDYTLGGGTGPYFVRIVRTVPPVDHEADSFVYTSTVPNTFTHRGPLETGAYYVKVVDALGCEKRIDFNIICGDLGNPSINYDCAGGFIFVTTAYSGALEYKIGAGAWTLLPANKKIVNIIANGNYPNYMRIRRVDNHSIEQTFNLVVNCNTCALKITSAVLTDACSKVTLVANDSWNEYKINSGAWTSGSSPITLGSALAEGGLVMVSIRHTDDPACFDSISLICSSCRAYDIGTPTIEHIDGDIVITGLDSPPSPTFAAGCTIAIEWWATLTGNTLLRQADVILPTSAWDTELTLDTGVIFVNPDNRVKANIYINCANNVKCLIGQLDVHITTEDDLGSLFYNCADPNEGIRWTGGSSDVQILLAGVWTGITLGTTLLNGSYQVRSVTVSEWDTITKTLVVSCAGGGGGSNPCEDFASFFTVTNACDTDVTIALSASAPYSCYVVLREHDVPGGCSGTSIIWNSTTRLLNPGSSITISGVPLANRMRSISYNLIGSGDACTNCFQIGTCTNGGSCPSMLFDSGDLICSTLGASPSNRSLRINNQNNFDILVYVDNLYAATVPANAINYPLGIFAFGSTHSVKLVCISDPTEFTTSETITLSC